MEACAVIKKLRENRGWSQEELAHRANSTAANISRIEGGKHAPGLGLFMDLARAFGLKPHQFMALVEGIALPDIQDEDLSEEALLLRRYRSLHAQQQRLIMEISAELARVTRLPD